MAHVSDFSQSSEKILLDLINEANHTQIPVTALTITKKADLGDIATVTASSNRGSGYRGNQEFTYNQVYLDRAFPRFIGEGKFVSAAGVETNLHSIINAALNLKLTDQDLTVYAGSGTLTLQEGYVNIIEITASESSLVWEGKLYIEIATLKIADALSYRVRMANTQAGLGVLPPTTHAGESDTVLVSEDGKVILGG